MELSATRVCLVLFLLAAMPIDLAQKLETDGAVEGVVLDIQDARIENATLTFWNGVQQYQTHTQLDGTYSIKLTPGTYTMSVSSLGFCTTRRAAFVLEVSASVRFIFQMWVCGSHYPFVQYTELDEVDQTHLKPVVLFGEREFLGEQDLQSAPQRFRGPKTNDDGAGHARRYPVIFTFNLLTVQADQLIYNPPTQLVKAIGNVRWENGANSGSGDTWEIKLDGLKPKSL